MRPGKGLFKVASWVLGITTLLAFLPGNVSAHPVDLSGVGRFGNKLTHIAQDIGKTLSELQTNIAADVQKITTTTTTTKLPPIAPEVPQKLVADADPTKDNKISSPSGKITLAIPKGAITNPSQIEFDEYNHQSSTGILSRFTLTAKDKISGVAFSKFNQNLQITIQNEPSDIAGLDPNSIKLYYQDEKTTQWVPVASSKFDPVTDILTGITDHFTNYGERGNSLIVGPGVVMAAQVGLQSGSAIFNYPFELPPGPGGFQPKLSLFYDSASVDEMKDKRDVGSWVGTGWALDFGKISYNPSDNTYSLEMNGISYQLVCTDQTQVNYHTNPEQYFKITRNGNTWNVYDKDGNYYRFGGTTDSQQYLSTSIYYRWDLSLIHDTHGNQATIGYNQNIIGTNVRSAYPVSLNYGSVQVLFTANYDTYVPADGYIRNDDPQSFGSNPAPLIMDDRKLISIAINMNGVLIRQYNFAYNTIGASYSSDYGGIIYAGTLTLTSLTEVGTDSSTQLPPMTFTYQSLMKSYWDNSINTYSGNPGNPALLYWPYLTVVNNGFGGSTSFNYMQIPASNPANIWSREAVIQKTVVDGISPNQTTQYAYTGNPAYNGTGWAAQFRGWNQVTETNAAGNYINHYFYTTGTINGNDAEKLTGKEYQTQWFNSVGMLLDTKNYNWNWTQIGQYTGLPLQQITPAYVTSFGGYTMYGSYYPSPTFTGVAVSSDGHVYGCCANSNGSIYKYTSNGTYVTSFGGYTMYGSYYPSPTFTGVAVSSDGYVYGCCANSNGSIYKYTSNGTYVTSFGGYTMYGSYYPSPTFTGVAVSSDGYVYGCCANSNGSIYKYTSNGTYVTSFGGYTMYGSYYPSPTFTGVAVSSDGYVYGCCANSNGSIYKYTSNGTYVTSFGGYTMYGSYYPSPTFTGVAVSSDGYVYGCCANSNGSIYKYTSNGTYVTSFGGYTMYGSYYPSPTFTGVAVSSDGYVYGCCAISNGSIFKYQIGIFTMYTAYNVYLSQVQDTVGTKTSQTRYSYDNYGNVITEYDDGDTAITTDDSTIWRQYFPNNDANILDKVSRERVYATAMTTDIGGTNLKKETDYNYDNQANGTPPIQGNLTSQVQWINASISIATSCTYDSYGNKLTETDGNNHTTAWTYDSFYHTYPATKTYPITGLSESYTYDPGTNNLLTSTDVNGQVTANYYDTFKRLTSVVKPGDSQGSPSITYQYNNWGTLNSQNVKTITKIDASNSIWKADYFDGLGRVIQTQAQSETSGHTIISATTTYNNCGQVSQQYVSQDIGSVLSAYYTTGIGSWKSTSYTYDGLGKVLVQTNPDSTTTSNDYTNPWQTNITNSKGLIIKDHYDAFNRLIEVQEPNSDNTVYATTYYIYDVLGNLKTVVDANSNTTSMTYDWLSRKTGMTDPDMGTWSYVYDGNSNLTSQTDARSQTISMVYDALNRLTNKNYPSGSGMTNIVYSYDSTASGNLGKGKRTGMTDAAGTTCDVYDSRGRLVSETKTISSVPYTTSYTYDGLDRAVTITYPTGETVTNTYNGRGLPNTVSGNTVGNLVTGTTYNPLGSITQINLYNGLKTTYGYYGTGGSNDTTGGYYGQLWEIKTLPQIGGTAIQDMQYSWDANGNMTQRQNLVSPTTTETFTYDSVDRLTGVSGAYTQSYSYNTIGNITAMNGTSYTYNTNGTRPHAVTAAGTTSYAYDANGNMTTRGAQTITWDVENRPLTVSGGTSLVYDGDGNRIEQIAGGQTTLYINQYYEKNLTTGVATTYYYLGGQLVAQNTGTTLKYVHPDSLGSTSVMSTSAGTLDSSISYFPFGLTRTGSVNTTKEFTSQRLDGTGLYYYNARYYDPQIGRFISPDSTGQDLNNPQTFNRYSYCLNNPLNRTDPSGHQSVWMLRYLSWRYTNNFASQIQVTDQCLLLNVGNLCNGFHEIAQINAAKALSKTDVFGVTLEEKLGKNCEADIVGGSQVWEVKPALNSKGENAAEQADDQLTKYCAMGDLKRGDNLGMNPIMDIPIVGDIKMKVDFDQDNRGVISYSFYNSGDPDQVLDPDAVKNSVLLYLLGSALVKIGEMGLGLDGGGLSPGGDPVGIPVSP